MRIPVEFVSRGYIDIPANTNKKAFEIAFNFLKSTSGDISVENAEIVQGSAKVLVDTSMLYTEDVCENWAEAQTEDVLIFRICHDEYGSHIIIVAAIEELDEKLSLIEFGYAGWEIPKSDVELVKTDGIFTVLDKLRSENRRMYTLSYENVFLSAARKYIAVLDEVQDKEELYNYLKINSQFNKKCLSEEGAYFMLRIMKEED